VMGSFVPIKAALPLGCEAKDRIWPLSDVHSAEPAGPKRILSTPRSGVNCEH